jgi:hypothetical protein
MLSTPASVASTPPAATAPPRIGGWVLLPALALAVQPLMFLRGLLALVTPHPAFMHVTVVWPVMLLDVVILLGVLFVARFFFTRKQVTPPLYVLYALTVFLLWNLVDAFTDQLHAPLVPLLVLVLGIVPYLTLSRRVARTFAAPLQAGHWLERPLLPLAPRLAALDGWLRRRRWWILPLALAFVVVVTALYAFLRATFVLGNPGEFWQLITG